MFLLIVAKIKGKTTGWFPISEGKKILIDGQQRVTTLKAAILGDYVVDKNYLQIKIKIALHPIEERFEAQNPVVTSVLPTQSSSLRHFNYRRFRTSDEHSGTSGVAVAAR